MYLGALGFVIDPTTGNIVQEAKAGSMDQSQRYNSCLASGGYWTGYSCVLPQAAPTPAPTPAPAIITVSVPTNVNTQVSPQISPNLIQQQQPTNSPVGAATSSNPSQSTAGEAAYADFLKTLQAQQELQAQQVKEDRQALIDAFSGKQDSAAATPSMISNTPASSYDEVPDTSGAVVNIAPHDNTKLYTYGLLAALLVGGAIIYSQRKKGNHRVH